VVTEVVAAAEAAEAAIGIEEGERAVLLASQR